MRRSKRSAQAASEEEPDELRHEADDHHHHHDDDGDDHQHHNQADDHHHHEGANAEDPWSWIRLQGTNRSRRDVRYVPKFIETALVLDKAMVHTQGIESNQRLVIFSQFQFINRAGLSRRDVIHEAIQVLLVANKKMLFTRFGRSQGWII